MKKLLISLVFYILTVSALGQEFERQNNETADRFVKRITKLDDLPHPVIETKEWDSTKKVIIYFVPDTKDDEEVIIGYLLIPTRSSTYQCSLIDTFYREGGAFERKIETVFFANADKGKEREILIITSLQAKAPKFADTYAEGFYYETYIYDNPDLAFPQKRLFYFSKLSDTFSSGFEGSIYDNKTGKFIRKEKAKYKDVFSIRQALKQMGY